MSDLVKLLLAFGLGYVLGALGMFCFIFREEIEQFLEEEK